MNFGRKQFWPSWGRISGFQIPPLTIGDDFAILFDCLTNLNSVHDPVHQKIPSLRTLDGGLREIEDSLPCWVESIERVEPKLHPMSDQYYYYDCTKKLGFFQKRSRFLEQSVKIVTSRASETRIPSQMPELSIGTVGTG